MNRNKEGKLEYILYAKNKLKKKSKSYWIFKSLEESMAFLDSLRPKWLKILSDNHNK